MITDNEREYRSTLEKMSTSEMLNTFKANMTALCTVIDTVVGADNPMPDPRTMNLIFKDLSPREWIEMFMDDTAREALRDNLRLMKAMEEMNMENRLIITRMLRTVVAE